ncbi:MAG: hypothetical protein WCL00_10850, partial [Bacteroidota bacterium]
MIKLFRIFLVICLVFLSSHQIIFAQCCSTGSPVGASVYVGVLNKNTLRVVGSYRYNYSNQYYEGAKKTDFPDALKYADYNFSGFGLGYGITKRLTIEADFGYFFNKTQQHRDSSIFTLLDDPEDHGKRTGYGFSNTGVTLKYGVYVKPSQQLEITLGTGFRFPFTFNPQMYKGTQLPRDVQPSTNAFGASGMFFFNKGFQSITLRLFSINRYDYNFKGKMDENTNKQYKYGNILMNSIFVSKKIVKYFFGILQLRSEWKANDQDNGAKVLNSGYWLCTLSPSLSYS